jgi:UMF1 family MFS transporter
MSPAAERDPTPHGPRGTRASIRAWCLYDWANSAFATTVMAALFPPFFREIAVAGGLSPVDATATWGYVTALALAVVAVLAPVLGAAADRSGRSRSWLGACALLGILATAAMPLIGAGQWRLAAALFATANVGFASSIVFYESLLPHLVPAHRLDAVSARGYALGYLGGGILLVINAAWVLRPSWFGLAGAGAAVRLSFASAAVWWAMFSIPLLRKVPDPPPAPDAVAGGNVLAGGLRRLRATFREVRQYRQLLLMLVAYWIYNDGIGTIVKMATAFGSEIGIATGDLVGALVLTQFVGWPCTTLWGRLARRLGARRVVLMGLAVYVLICVGGLFLRAAWQFYLLAGLVGTVQGGTQSLSRSLFAAMVPRHKSAEFFGFYATSGKLAGIAGPLVFGLVAQATGASRLSVFALIVFFVVGGALLWRLDEKAGAAAAREAERAVGAAGGRAAVRGGEGEAFH